MVILLKDYLKINYPLIFAIGAVISGLILNTWSSFYLIFKLESTPPDRLIYLISFNPNPFEWIYKTLIGGFILTISGLILLLYIVFLKKKPRFN